MDVFYSESIISDAEIAMLPKDPFMLLSVVNTKLRDEYASLSELCAAEGIDRNKLEEKLHEAGFDYVPARNQFR